MPVAAHLAAGGRLASAGAQIDVADLVTLPAPTSRVHDGEAEGEVMSVDRFGNVQLSIAASDADRLGLGFGSPVVVRCGRRQLTVPYLETFAAVAPGEIVAYHGQRRADLARGQRGDAAQQLGLPPGAHVRLSAAIRPDSGPPRPGLHRPDRARRPGPAAVRTGLNMAECRGGGTEGLTRWRSGPGAGQPRSLPLAWQQPASRSLRQALQPRTPSVTRSGGSALST